MNASIITIGDELLIGQIINTNSAWLAEKLTSAGFSIIRHLSIPDRAEDIIESLEELLPKNNLLIFTGGLGPTNDDITKKVLAEQFASDMIFSETVFRDVEKRLNGSAVGINKKNRDQAMVPQKAKILRNHHGTAPGMWFEQEGSVIISLPGVPREMKGIYTDYIESGLKNFFTLPEILYKTVMTTGIAESVLAETIEDWEKNLPEGVSLAYLPSPGQVRLRLGIFGPDREFLSKVINTEIDKLIKIIPDFIYGFDDEKLETVLGRMIETRNKTLSVAESCTGGTISSRITALPGCSAWYKGGITAYSNEIKSGILKVKEKTLEDFGAVSKETIEEMARGALRLFNSDYAIATSGIAGPGGGSPQKPVGTVWIAAGFQDRDKAIIIKKKFSFGTSRPVNIERSANSALNLLRQLIEEEDSTN